MAVPKRPSSPSAPLGVALLAGLVVVGCERAPANEAERLDQSYAAAASEYAVPRPLLEALGYSETRWWMRPGEPSIDQGYGVMHLVDRGEGGPLAKAAVLTGYSQDRLRNEVDANVRGAAALLRAEADRYFRENRDKRETDLSAWWQVVMRYSGWDDAQAADDYATSVFQIVGRGARGTLPDGSVHGFGAVPVEVDGEKLFGRMESALTPDFAGADPHPAASTNYTAGRSLAISMVVIHTAQGSYAGTYNWFANPASQVSAHYVVASDGRLAQMVNDRDTAWHGGNWDVNSKAIGIEHEGFVDQPSYFTEAMYVKSAALTKWLCDTYRIPKDRQHVIGHNEIPDPNNPGQFGGSGHHHDPCVTLDGSQCFWNWAHYMDLVGGSSGTTTGTTGTLLGYVYDANGCPSPSSTNPNCHGIVGARVFIPETGATTLADANGKWSFALPTGDYSPSASFAGYQDGTPFLGAKRHVAAGTTTYGSFVLNRIAGTGIVKGLVYEVNPSDLSDHATRVDGALVGVGTNIASAGQDGTFRLTGVPSGQQTVTVQRDGYVNGTAAVTVVDGAEVSVEIGLTASDSQPPTVAITYPADGAVVGTNPVTVEGTVDDPAATLKVNGADVSIANGKFSTLVAVVTGDNVIEAVATDAGGNEGRASLKVTYDPTRPGLTGKVLDAISGAPVKGAVVSVGEAFAKTAEDGFYSLDAPAGDSSVAVQALGYLARTATVTVKDTGRTTQDLHLVPANAGELVTITSPADGSTAATATVTVTGISRVPQLVALKVNDLPATVETDGSFSTTLTLKAGANTIVARGRGRDGLEASTQITVTFGSPKSGCGCGAGVDAAPLALLGLVRLLRRRRA